MGWKEKLEQYRFLDKEIAMLREEICTLERESEAEIVCESIKEGRRAGQYPVKRKRLLQMYIDRLDSLMDERLLIEEFIGTIESSELRQILTLYYVKGKPWQQVAKAINQKYGTVGIGDREKKIVSRFFKKLENSR